MFLYTLAHDAPKRDAHEFLQYLAKIVSCYLSKLLMVINQFTHEYIYHKKNSPMWLLLQQVHHLLFRVANNFYVHRDFI